MMIEELRERWPFIRFVRSSVLNGECRIHAILSEYSFIRARKARDGGIWWRKESAACKAIDSELRYIHSVLEEG